MKCNVAQFVGSVQDGGAETLIKDYLLMLDKDKFNAKAIVLRRNRNTANDNILMNNKVDIIPIFKSDRPVLKVIQKINYWWYVPFQLKRILKRENINVLHIHMALLKYVSRIRYSIKNIKLLYTCHNLPELFLKRMHGELSAAKKLIKQNGMQMIALHDDMRKEINEMLGIDNTVVVKNGIDFRRFKKITESKIEIRQKLDIPESSYVIGHIGRFADQKNHDFLVDIFEEIYKKRQDAFLLMVGDGKLLNVVWAKIKRLHLSDRVKILSHRSDIPQLLKAMDVFVFPSKFEGLGIVLIEAQVSGLRCVVSDTVPEEAFQTKLAVPVSLKESPERWAKIILDKSIDGKRSEHIEKYDMNIEIRCLEKLYLGEMNKGFSVCKRT